ncbi:pleiotropic regulatory protein RsmS [Pectobacterium cacticida]|uniref:Pleiotropic regulatory protein RsmS n=1 Tax=Pectobacterium cacticida TaxID=69221 RepID=A0ABZ2G800_9GAMM|nr:pleiotropic regulatory protein RsmS [Pectobacterium cacticida]UYX07703.1 pleiotropic regulatory protein RsmS [Pectobacterium cacticida]
MSLENAPPEVKLAVDLIMLLEENQIDPHIALAALEIVRTDVENKCLQKASGAQSIAQGQKTVGKS